MHETANPTSEKKGFFFGGEQLIIFDLIIY